MPMVDIRDTTNGRILRISRPLWEFHLRYNRQFELVTQAPTIGNDPPDAAAPVAAPIVSTLRTSVDDKFDQAVVVDAKKHIVTNRSQGSTARPRPKR